MLTSVVGLRTNSRTSCASNSNIRSNKKYSQQESNFKIQLRLLVCDFRVCETFLTIVCIHIMHVYHAYIHIMHFIHIMLVYTYILCMHT